MASIDFDLMMKYFSGKSSPEEAERVEDFARSSSEEYAYFQIFFAQWTQSGNENYQKPEVQKEWERFKKQYLEVSPKRRPIRTLAVAASVLILLGLGIYFTFFNSQRQPEMMTFSPTAQQSKLLSDSTIVTLNKNAKLHCPQPFSKKERVVSLKGNAEFEVHHNSHWPFIIHLAHNLNIQVTGTSFFVSQTPDEVRIDLHRGSVLFYNQKDTIALAANQTGRYLISEQKFILVLPKPERGSFTFKNVPLTEVAAQLQSYFHTQIDFGNPGIANCRLTADFKNQSLKEIIQIIAVTFNFDYKINDGNIYIDGEACQ